MKRVRNWLLVFVSLTLLCLAGVAGLIYVIDPFFQYHKPLGKFPYIVDNQVNMNPGLARNMDYDSVLLGSSMTVSFNTDWFDRYCGLKTQKLSYNGAFPKDQANIMEVIFKNKGKLEKNKNKIINVEVNTSEQAIRRLLETKEEITDHVWNKLYKKEIFDGIKYTIIREFEDIATMYKLFEKSKKIVYTNYEGYYYVRRDNSLTANVDIKSIQNELYAVKSRYEYLKEKYSFLEEILMQNRAQYALIYHTSCAKVGAKNIFNENCTC